jgi:hypothetical protein
MVYSANLRAAFTESFYSDPTGAQANFAPFGDELTAPAHMMFITSNFNRSVYLSTDGTTNMLLVPDTSGLVILDFAANKEGTSKLFLPAMTQFYLKQGPGGAPTQGEIEISFIIGV